MSREITMKLNQILYQRSRDWYEKTPKTGILRLLERGDFSISNVETFDDYLRDHIKTSNKTINIRGLFRVPDISGGERLMINVEEKEEGNIHEEQKLQIPMGSSESNDKLDARDKLPSDPNESLPPHSKAMMSYPMGKPKYPEGKKLSIEPSSDIIDVEGKQTIDYYIDLAKQQPGKKLAFIHKTTKAPRFGITYDGNKVMISSGKPAMELNYLKEGKLNREYIDKIYSFTPFEFKKEDLPPDVEFRTTTYYSSDDDDDPDKGGQKEKIQSLSKKRRKKEEPEEEEKIPFSYSGKPKGGGDYPDEGGEIIFTKDKPLPYDEDLDKSFVTARGVSRKNSDADDYRMEIALLESKRDKLMKDVETLELEFPKMENYRLELATHLQKLKEEIDLLENIESSAKEHREEMENKYEAQKKEIENMKMEKEKKERDLRDLRIKHREEIEEWKLLYEESKKESKDDIDELTKGYKEKIREMQDEIRGLRENAREKDYQINQLNKGMEMGNAHVIELQEDLNRYKDLYFKLKNEESEVNKKIKQLEWSVQDQSDKTSEINKLREYIQKIEPQLTHYQGQIQQLVNELNQTKQNAAIEQDKMIKIREQELMTHADAKHNQILAEKEKELKQKYSELENQFIELKADYDYGREQFIKEVNKAANAKAMLMTLEKDQVIQGLQGQIDHFLSQQGSHQVKERVEMEEEAPKIEPERIEIEENKEGEEKTFPPPTQGMQTRSQGPPSYGEKFHQEEYDPLGNLTWKGNVYSIPNMRDYKAYEVVVNLLDKATGVNRDFKTNFIAYAKGKEGDRINYDTRDNMGYVTKAIEILGEELNNDKRDMAIAMKYIIDNSTFVYAKFKEIYKEQYANYLKK